MGKYNGYFNSYKCKKYEVRITPSGSTGNYEEVPLAGNEPFIVRYDTSKTPFDPIRTSTASIKVVNDEYLYDALSNCAQGTKVELLDITDSENISTQWVGYMTPKVYNAGYDSCWESFDLEAADCISSLQYIDYAELSGGGVTSIKKIIEQICDATGELDGYYWPISKRTSGGTIITPDMLFISEHNFQTNDTEEYWKLDEVLKEICQYLGFTCLQWKRYMYFLDYQVLEPNASMTGYLYRWSGNGYIIDNTGGSVKNFGNYYEISQESYMGSDSTISLEPVYNKVVVNANMYAVDDFIPNPFDDEFITNRIDSGNPFAAVEIPPHANTIAEDYPYNQWYPNGADAIFWQSWKMEIADEVKKHPDDHLFKGDDRYIYYMRPYNHKYWESVYTSPSTGSEVQPSESAQASSVITSDYRGGTLLDLGVVRKEHKSESNPAQWIVPNKMDYTRYLCICEKHTNDHSGGQSLDKGAGKVVYRLKEGYKSKARLDNKCFLVLNCSCIFERYENCNYINPDWCDAESKQRGTESGTWVKRIPRPSFRIHIGGKGWSSSSNAWVTAGSAGDICSPQMKWDENKFTYWNKSLQVLNNVSWQDKVNAEGIKIPLEGVDTTQAITFEVINPAPSFYGNTGNPNWEHKFYDMNSYCWISDLSLKVVREGESDLGNDSDVIYENVIDECSVNDMAEIRVRITTFTDVVKPSYSHMLTEDGYLESVLEQALGNSTAQKPEENIIQKYVHQYQTPTKKFTLPLPIELTPMQKLYGVNVEEGKTYEGYVQLGTEMDFQKDRQTITAVQKTK